MAIYHLSVTPVQRSKGHSAVAGAAYRSGSVLQEQSTGLTHDYTRKRGIVQSQIIAPENAPDWTHDRAQLWNRAELAEKRKDAQPAREIRLALPAELTDEERAALVFNYARDTFVSAGMIADISIHRPDRHGDDRNHHAHIYLTMRELDGDNFSTKKQRAWNQTETLEYWREQWEEYQNAALDEAGSSERVDHRSYEEQGIDREATHHLGKTASALEREGKESRIGNENREIEGHNNALDVLVNEYAQLESEIQAELENHFFPTDPPQPRTWQEVKAEAQSAWNSEFTKAYTLEPAATPEQENERQERRWYETIYTKSVEVVKQYWQRFVSRNIEERDRERNDYEPER